MMNVGLEERNVYEDLDPHDTYFFKIGVHGLVCFHGRNYSIKQRLSAEQTSKLISDPNFYRISTNCYVNLSKVSDIQDNVVYFRDERHGIKTIHVPKRNLGQMKRLIPSTRRNVTAGVN
ncbi:MAG: LytTR family transcriptional regulator DNA-binding domain-containing protein [Paenibacillus macerans]|uniref:LytTr DNA-binding domain protein n=1 Tax=Paenibacillus macerans TaxID=44252 RepID=A0A090ZD43_PAEMA|nr:LytTR family transcriptional regulator DNA-binding domain-containing protein [Paenibacillus macerans]KFN09234.1 lytTr DNA-binding domain protein [Paenibacillus macerans]MBS5914283.1 LytTR family transcriptional regulator DNA-binding domain-containing protein [Paenibacillus macerans]MCY7559957.1 LytTR family transcriptional regulator DNA-binding domain-containing protein [Paenibacillus macerans]MDU7477138.1 LytTR family transcriptional regulator DNA-binding domain-containing protein [Paenibac